MIETGENMLTVFCLEPRFCSRILFIRMQLSDVYIPVFRDRFRCLMKNMIQVFYMLENETKGNQIIFFINETPGLIDIRLNEMRPVR